MSRMGRFPHALKLDDLKVDHKYVLHDLQARTRRTITVIGFDARLQQLVYRNRDGEIVNRYYVDLGLVPMNREKDLWHSNRYMTKK